MLVSLVASVFSSAPAALALDPPPADSLDALRARLGQTVELIRTVAAGTGLPEESIEGLATCDALRETACDRFDPKSCRVALAGVFTTLRSRRADTSDPLVRAVADRTATYVSGTLSLLAWRSDARAPADCERLAPRGREPALVLVAEDGKSLAVEPLTALRDGREYALVLEGDGAPTASPAPPLANDAERIRARFAGAPGGPEGDRVLAYVEGLERASAAAAGRASFASVRLVVPDEIRAEDLGSLRASFVPARSAPDKGVVLRFETLDPRAGLLHARAQLRERGCAPVALQPIAADAGAPLPSGVVAYAGRARSLEEAPDAPVRDVPLTTLLPVRVDDRTPLVVALDGHQGSAAKILARHGGELAALGLAVLSFDLPGHGVRASEGDFVVAADPARLTRGMRQAAIDLVAAVGTSLDCGFALPGGRAYRPRSVRFLGYSLGSMIGAIARSVEPDLGTAVFLAPGGDLFGWLMLRLGPALGGRFVACLGGAEHGETCIDDGACAPPGRCIVDPFFQALHETAEPVFRQATAGGDPLSFATHRTGDTSHGRLLLITGGNDAVLHPALATRLADAYGMHVVAPHRRRGPGSTLVQWPQLGHDLHDRADVRRQAHEFLASDGRRLLATAPGGPPEAPGWYRVFGSSR